MLTKKAKLEQFDKMAAERDLLALYLHDTQQGTLPIVVRKGIWRANLYRPTGAAGGYIVLKQGIEDSSHSTIHLFEDLEQEIKNWQYTADWLDFRTVIERCRIERDKAIRGEREKSDEYIPQSL